MRMVKAPTFWPTVKPDELSFRKKYISPPVSRSIVSSFSSTVFFSRGAHWINFHPSEGNSCGCIACPRPVAPPVANDTHRTFLSSVSISTPILSSITDVDTTTPLLTDGWPDDLYQRFMAFVDNNSLQTVSALTHHGVKPVVDEEMRSSLENIVILFWFHLVHLNSTCRWRSRKLWSWISAVSPPINLRSP